MIFARVPVQHRRLLPDHRLSGPTPWVIAILMMLTLLAAAGGVGLARSADAIGEAIAGRVTVQIVTANPVLRAQQAAALRRAAAAQPFVRSARAVDPAELQATLGQWFGTADGDDPVLRSLPMPALVDVDFVGEDRSGHMGQLRALVAREARHPDDACQRRGGHHDGTRRAGHPLCNDRDAAPDRRHRPADRPPVPAPYHDRHRLWRRARYRGGRRHPVADRLAMVGRDIGACRDRVARADGQTLLAALKKIL